MAAAISCSSTGVSSVSFVWVAAILVMVNSFNWKVRADVSAAAVLFLIDSLPLHSKCHFSAAPARFPANHCPQRTYGIPNKLLPKRNVVWKQRRISLDGEPKT